MRCFLFLLYLIACFSSFAQSPADTSMVIENKVVTLSEVVIAKGLDVPWFINRVVSDSSFYKAFRNLHIIGFTSINDIRMLDKQSRVKASLHSKTRQLRKDNCRLMEVLDEVITGDIYNEDHLFNYYTAEMYASLFFTRGEICDENNIVAGRDFSTADKSGLEKHKEQLKMLFFNPGKRIHGIPFISAKTALFNDDIASLYDISIDAGMFNGVYCYKLTQQVKQGNEDQVIIDNMTTWFNDSTFDVVARNYDLSYDAGIFDFKVGMQVEISKWGALSVPTLIRYNGSWKAPFKKRERGIFTAIVYEK